jgi:methylenetetrahydrofolate dehydrogenase (NADP+)/methenyltetrahydrofolate cyclohydrolase
VGKPNFVQGDWIKPGAVVLDAGYNEGNIGDVHYNDCLQNAYAITPSSSGSRASNNRTLLKHTVDAAENFYNPK